MIPAVAVSKKNNRKVPRLRAPSPSLGRAALGMTNYRESINADLKGLLRPEASSAGDHGRGRGRHRASHHRHAPLWGGPH